MSLETPPLPRTGLKALLAGFSLPLQALRLISRHRPLTALALVCAAVTALTLGALALVAWPLASSASGQLVGSGGALKDWARLALSVVFFLALYGLGALTVPALLLAPLQDPLSSATEEALGAPPAPPFRFPGDLVDLAQGTWLSLTHTLLRVSLQVLGFVLLVPLNLVPLVGSATFSVLAFGWTALCLSAEYLSGPMARHRRPFSEVVAALREHPALSLSFGASLALLLWVPVVNAFLVPVAVVAGTLLHRGLSSRSGQGALKG